MSNNGLSKGNNSVPKSSSHPSHHNHHSSHSLSSSLGHHQSNKSSSDHQINLDSSSTSSSSNQLVPQRLSPTSVNVHLIWPIVLRPLLYKIMKRNQFAAVTLQNALGNAERGEPGFLLEFVTAILASREIKVNMTEMLLRLQANIPEYEGMI